MAGAMTGRGRVVETTELTRREREVALKLCAAKTHKEAAHELGISDKTVGIHVYRVFRKLGVNSAVGLVRHAYANGWEI